jgi:hypothetical protein
MEPSSLPRSTDQGTKEDVYGKEPRGEKRGQEATAKIVEREKVGEKEQKNRKVCH